MNHDNDNRKTNRLRVKLLFGLFEANASGTIGIGAALTLFVLMAAGRWSGLW